MPTNAINPHVATGFPAPVVVARRYTPLNHPSNDCTGLAAESQAGLRQLSLDRLTAYGCDLSDAQELRARVEGGALWLDSVGPIIERQREMLGEAASVSPQTRANLVRRISALLRASQLMMMRDDERRRAIFTEASKLHAESGRTEGAFERLLVDADGRVCVGWQYPPVVGAGPVVIVVGGIEGWAMDLHSVGVEISRRGMTALLLDGPGQGESRIRYGHYMGRDWLDDYKAVVTHVTRAYPGRRIGILGNSMGGSFATLLASADPRISACCNNGGIEIPLDQKKRENFFPKLSAFCGDVPAQDVDAVWDSVQSTKASVTLSCPYLIVQGAMDPLVSQEESERMLGWARSTDKSMLLFSDGIHCVYNHAVDMRNAIADWFMSRLCGE